MERIAIVIGATGLIGKQLVELLLDCNNFIEVKVFVRKDLNINHPKLRNIKTDFDNIGVVKEEIKGTDLFICMGTTIKVAGSQSAFYKIDHNYPLQFASLAKENGIENIYLVSSIGANSKSRNFYLKTKGALEENLAKLNFKKVIIFQPSMLLGNRTEKRTGEKIGQVLMTKLDFLFFGPLLNYKAIDSGKVAKAMLDWSLKEYSGLRVISSSEMNANY